MQVHEISISALEALASRSASDCNKTGHGLMDTRDSIHVGKWLVVRMSASFDYGFWFDVWVRRAFDSLEKASAWASEREAENAYCLSAGLTGICDEYEVWHVVDDSPASDVVRQDHVVEPTHDKDFSGDGKPRNYHLMVKFPEDIEDLSKASRDGSVGVSPRYAKTGQPYHQMTFSELSEAFRELYDLAVA